VVAEVRLILNSLIEIARDLEAYGCQREMVISHFMLHAQHDRGILSAYTNRTFLTLKAKPEAQLLGDGIQGDGRDAAAAAIARVMDEVVRSLEKDRNDAFDAVDDGEELQRLSDACIRAL
jgi:hypothetical protein